jgi:SAM-dependent methyltransferase
MSTDWEAHYQRGETPWDKGAPSPGLVDFLARHPVRGRVLVPGCGFGHDVRALAATAQEVVGLDLAPSAVSGAEALPKVGGERYVLGDFLNPVPGEMRGFDWVWEHTCFCAISPSQRPTYVRAVASALRPGGEFLAVFYLDPGNSSPEEGPPFEVSKEELDALFKTDFELVDEWLPLRAYPGREGREWMRRMRRR